MLYGSIYKDTGSGIFIPEPVKKIEQDQVLMQDLLQE
jgi:hypothetical protein